MKWYLIIFLGVIMVGSVNAFTFPDSSNILRMTFDWRNTTDFFDNSSSGNNLTIKYTCSGTTSDTCARWNNNLTGCTGHSCQFGSCSGTYDCSGYDEGTCYSWDPYCTWQYESCNGDWVSCGTLCGGNSECCSTYSWYGCNWYGSCADVCGMDQWCCQNYNPPCSWNEDTYTCEGDFNSCSGDVNCQQFNPTDCQASEPLCTYSAGGCEEASTCGGQTTQSNCENAPPTCTWGGTACVGSLSCGSQSSYNYCMDTTGCAYLSGVNSTKGKIGNGTRFYGTSQGYLYNTNSPSLNIQTNFTIALWINVTQGSAGGSFVSKVKPVYAGGYMFVMNNNAVRFSIYRATGFPNQMDLDTTGSITDGKWHHLVGTYNGTGATVYIDGYKNVTKNYAVPPATSEGMVFYVGGRYDTALILNGTLDEIYIFNRSMNASEVLDLYNYGWTQESPPSAGGTVNNCNEGVTIYYNNKVYCDCSIYGVYTGNINNTNNPYIELFKYGGSK